MKRREFLSSALASSIGYALSPLTGGHAQAEISNIFPALDHRILVFIHLPGGPDLRYLLPPAYDSNTNSYGYQSWQAKASAHGLDTSAPESLQQRWQNDYSPFESGGTAFGILNQAGWLQSMWSQGNVAIVNNVLTANNRNHAHCQLILDQGNVDSSRDDIERSGWGGRFAQANSTNIVSLTSTPRNFCFGGVSADPEKRTDAPIISLADSRNIALYHPASGDERTVSGELARSLKSYYAAKRNQVGTNSNYRQFIDHELKARTYGNQISAQLASEPIPASVEALYSGENPLSSAYFGRQIRNLRDSLVLTNVLNFRVASMEYSGWDTHHSQKERLDPKFNDIFGTGKGLDSLYQELPDHIAEKLVFVIAGEFGRQIKSNGAAGTDHGSGSSMLIIGNEVNGIESGKASTVFGEMFPEAELDRLNQNNPDIIGLTEIDHILGAVCDAVTPGSSHIVFPRKTSRILESGVDLSTLFG